MRREIFAMKTPVLSSSFLFFSHKTLDKHNSQRKAPLDFENRHSIRRTTPFCVLWLTIDNFTRIVRAANATLFCSSGCAHAQFTMQARVASSPVLRTASDESLGLWGRGYCRCANMSDDPLGWWKALVGICPGGMYSNKSFPYTYIDIQPLHLANAL